MVAEKGEGAIVEDPDGNRFLDFAAGIAVVATGHCHPRVVKAVQAQAARLIHMSGTDFYYENMVALAEKLASLVPVRGVAGSGTRHVHLAIRDRSDRGGHQAGALPHRSRPVRGVRGRVPWPNHGLAGAHGEQEHPAKGVLSGDAGRASHAHAYCYRCAYGKTPDSCAVECVQAIETELFRTMVPSSDVAAIFVEPIQGEGGYVVPPRKFFDELRRLAVKHDILLVADEVQTGMGRTGKMFASEHFGLEPDIMTLAKGIASGLPLGAMVARAELMDWKPGAHASTFGGNPVAVAASLTTIELLEQELVANAGHIGARLMARLGDLRALPHCGRRSRTGADDRHRAGAGSEDQGACAGSAGSGCPDVLRARLAGAGGGSEHDPAMPAAGDQPGPGGFRGANH